jgi:hypothetical protein
MAQVKIHPKNVGKSVRFSTKRGDKRTETIGQIVRFRGAAHAFVGYHTAAGHYGVTCLPLSALEYTR